MTRAQIVINGTSGSNDDLPIGTVVNLGNDGNGGETTYLWTVVDQPEGTADVLTSTTTASTTLTPNKEGTYLLQLVVNANLPDESVDEQIIGIRYLRTLERAPAAQETVQDGSPGWKTAINRLLKRVDHLSGDPGIIVAQAATPQAVGTIVRVVGVATIKSGLPGQEYVPIVNNAALIGTFEDGPYGIIVGACRGNTISGQLVFVRMFGLVVEVPGSGSPTLGALVYCDLTASQPTLSTTSQVIGRVVGTSLPTSGQYLWMINGLSNGW
jgi:hypothetical protein